MQRLFILLVMCMLSSILQAENFDDLKQKMKAATQDQNRLGYPLNISFYPGKSSDEEILLVLHG